MWLGHKLMHGYCWTAKGRGDTCYGGANWLPPKCTVDASDRVTMTCAHAPTCTHTGRKGLEHNHFCLHRSTWRRQRSSYSYSIGQKTYFANLENITSQSPSKSDVKTSNNQLREGEQGLCIKHDCTRDLASYWLMRALLLQATSEYCSYLHGLGQWIGNANATACCACHWPSLSLNNTLAFTHNSICPHQQRCLGMRLRWPWW